MAKEKNEAEKVKAKIRAKKKEKSKEKGELEQQNIFEEGLPQNFKVVGASSNEEKKVYIFQKIYNEIHAFTKNKTENESGGFLVGRVENEFGKTNIIVTGFIEAKYTESTNTTLKFTHKTWEACNETLEKKFSKQKIVGWIHTHPNFGIFLSEYDTFIQKNFFAEDFQIAYVIDPIQKTEGFYYWQSEEIKASSGFYVFDRMGKKIDIEEGDDENESADYSANKPAIPLAYSIIIGLLVVCVLFLGFLSFRLDTNLKILDAKLESLEKKVELMEQALVSTQEYIIELHGLPQPPASGTETNPGASSDSTDDEE